MDASRATLIVSCVRGRKGGMYSESSTATACVDSSFSAWCGWRGWRGRRGDEGVGGGWWRRGNDKGREVDDLQCWLEDLAKKYQDTSNRATPTQSYIRVIRHTKLVFSLSTCIHDCTLIL